MNLKDAIAAVGDNPMGIIYRAGTYDANDRTTYHRRNTINWPMVLVSGEDAIAEDWVADTEVIT